MSTLLHSNYLGNRFSFVVSQVVGIQSKGTEDVFLYATDGGAYKLSESYDTMRRKLEVCLGEGIDREGAYHENGRDDLK